MTNTAKKPFRIIYIQCLVLLPLLTWTTYFVVNSIYSRATPTTRTIQTPYTKPNNEQTHGNLMYKSLTGKQTAKKPDNDIPDLVPKKVLELKPLEVVASNIDLKKDEYLKKQEERTDELKRDKEVHSLKPKIPDSHEKDVADTILKDDVKTEESDSILKKEPEKNVKDPELKKEAQIEPPKSNHEKGKTTEDSLKKTPAVPQKGENEAELKLNTPKSVPETRPVEKEVNREDKSNEQKKEEEEEDEDEEEEDEEEEDENRGGKGVRRGRNTFKKN